VKASFYFPGLSPPAFRAGLQFPAFFRASPKPPSGIAMTPRGQFFLRSLNIKDWQPMQKIKHNPTESMAVSERMNEVAA
jgi:hypothetical protein